MLDELQAGLSWSTILRRRDAFRKAFKNFEPERPIKNTGRAPARTPRSEQISKELEARGFKFVGPIIVYAWMQAVGMVNDHSPKCFRSNAAGLAPVRAR